MWWNKLDKSKFYYGKLLFSWWLKEHYRDWTSFDKEAVAYYLGKTGNIGTFQCTRTDSDGWPSCINVWDASEGNVCPKCGWDWFKNVDTRVGDDLHCVPKKTKVTDTLDIYEPTPKKGKK